MQIILLPLDLLPTYIPFVVQCNKADGTKSDPTADNLIIYEEGGADATFDSTTITGSPFDPAQINSKTGLWGKLVAKSAFTAGKLYIAVWEMTVDSKTTAAVELYLACNASDFKASLTTLESRLSSTRATYLDNLSYLTAAPPTATAIRTEMDSNSTKLANLDATISSRAAASTALSSATWTATRAGYLDKLNVSGTLAHTDNAASFKATGFAVAGDAMTLTAAYDRAKNALALSEYTAAPTATSIRTEIDNNSTMLSSIEALAITIAERSDRLPDDPASETTLTALQNAVNGISNVTRLTTAIPTYITLPSAGNTIVRIDVALKDTSGSMEDADSNIMAVTVSDAAGTSKNANLYQDYAVTTGLTAISGGTFDGYRQLVRSGVGLYYFFYKCTSTDTEGERIFRFGWAEGGVALYEFRVSQVTLATSDVSAIANNVNTLLTRLTAPRGDKLDYLDAAISSRLAASSYTTPPTVGAIADQVWDETYGTHLNSGSFGKFVSDINTRIDVTLSTRSSHSAADVWSSGTRTLTGTVSVGDKTGFSLTSAYDPAKTCAQSATALSNAVWTDTKAGYVDATISSRLAATDYTAPDNAGILSSIAGVSDQVTGISDVTVNIDSTGLATQQTVEAIKAKTDNLPDDPVSEAALALMFANIAGDVWANTDRTLTGAVDVDADSFHAALNSWTPPSEPPIPPIILPPPNAEDCRVYLWIGGQSAHVIPTIIDKATAKIVNLPFVAYGRFFCGQEIAGTYNPDTGILYWDIIRGANVRVTVPIVGFNRQIPVPDAETLDLSTL